MPGEKPSPALECALRIVTASGSEYVLIGRQVIRLPRHHAPELQQADPSVDLRRDGEPLPVLSATEPVVGLPWDLLLQLRGDGVSTLRSTTPVVRVEHWEGSRCSCGKSATTEGPCR